MRAKSIAALTLLLGIVAHAAMPPMPSPAQAKEEMEQKIVDEVSGILDRFLGPGRSHVTVFLNVEVKSPDQARSAARKDKKLESKWVWREISKKPKMSVLPGFNVNPEVTVTDNKDKKPEEKAGDDSQDSSDAYEIDVRRILVSIVLDSSISEKNEKMIEVMVSEVIGLDPDRGDHLNVYRLPLQPAWKGALETPETLMRIFWGAVALIALAMFLYFITRSIQAINESRSLLPERPAAKSDLHAEGNLTANHHGEALGGGGDGHGDAEMAAVAPDAAEVKHQRLDFVTLDNFEMLSELLKDSDPQEIASILGFVDPVLSSRILDRLSPDKRLETMMYLVSAASIPPHELAEIRRAWRERLECAFGGTGAVGELLSAMDPNMQKMFMERLKAVSPDLAPRVSDALIRMEDLARIEATDLGHLTQAVSFEDWAKALAPMPQPYKDRVLAVLPDSSRQVLQQWLSLTKPKKIEVDQSQMKVLAMMRSMIRQGRIALAKDPLPMPTAKPAEAPAGKAPAVAVVPRPAVPAGSPAATVTAAPPKPTIPKL